MEKLFSLELGTLEDQMDLFLRDGLPSAEKNRLFFYNGLFVIANGASRKIMEFSSYGDLLTLYYNPDTNPQPVLLGMADSRSNNRRAFAYNFNEIGEISFNSRNQLYVEDLVPPERRSFDPALQGNLQSLVLRFSKDGKFLDYLGQEGIGGTPFPAIQQLTNTANDETAVVCRTGLGWVVWWFSAEGNPLGRTVLDLSKLPLPPDAPKGTIASLEALYPDRQSRSLEIQIDYFLKDRDATNSSDSSIELFQSRVWTFEASRQAFSNSFALPILPRIKAKNAKEDPSGDRPYAFLGISDSGNHFFLSSLDADGQRFLVCDRQGKALLERNIEFKGENSLFSQLFVSPQGVLTGMVSDGKKVELVWWRSDKLLNGYGQANF